MRLGIRSMRLGVQTMAQLSFRSRRQRIQTEAMAQLSFRSRRQRIQTLRRKLSAHSAASSELPALPSKPLLR